MFIIFFISALAETNRPPFDLPEAESELVAGFMVEYSSTPYLLFMLGEYVAIVTMCALTTILFLGGWLPPVDVAPLHLDPGRCLVHLQGRLRLLHVRLGEGDRAALPLRPADAPGLEGVPAAVAVHGASRRRRGCVARSCAGNCAGEMAGSASGADSRGMSVGSGLKLARSLLRSSSRRFGLP